MPQDYTQEIQAGFSNAGRIMQANRAADEALQDSRKRYAAASVIGNTSLFSDDPALKQAMMAGLRTGTLDPGFATYVGNMKRAQQKDRQAAAQQKFANELAASRYALDVSKDERDRYYDDVDSIRKDAAEKRLQAQYELDSEKHGWEKQKWYETQKDNEFERRLRHKQWLREERRLDDRLGLDVKKHQLASQQQRFEEHKYRRQQNKEFLDSKPHYDAISRMIRVYSPMGGTEDVFAQMMQGIEEMKEGASAEETVAKRMPKVPYHERPLIVRHMKLAAIKENIRTRQEMGLVPLDVMRAMGDVQLGYIDQAMGRFDKRVQNQLQYEFVEAAKQDPSFVRDKKMTPRGMEWMQDRIMEHISDGLSGEGMQTGNLSDWFAAGSMDEYETDRRRKQAMAAATKASNATDEFMDLLNSEMGGGPGMPPREEVIRQDYNDEVFGASGDPLSEEDQALRQIREVPDFILPLAPDEMGFVHPGDIDRYQGVNRDEAPQPWHLFQQTPGAPGMSPQGVPQPQDTPRRASQGGDGFWQSVLKSLGDAWPLLSGGTR